MERSSVLFCSVRIKNSLYAAGVPVGSLEKVLVHEMETPVTQLQCGSRANVCPEG